MAHHTLATRRGELIRARSAVRRGPVGSADWVRAGAQLRPLHLMPGLMPCTVVWFGFVWKFLAVVVLSTVTALHLTSLLLASRRLPLVLRQSQRGLIFWKLHLFCFQLLVCRSCLYIEDPSLSSVTPVCVSLLFWWLLTISKF